MRQGRAQDPALGRAPTRSQPGTATRAQAAPAHKVTEANRSEVPASSDRHVSPSALTGSQQALPEPPQAVSAALKPERHVSLLPPGAGGLEVTGGLAGLGELVGGVEPARLIWQALRVSVLQRASSAAGGELVSAGSRQGLAGWARQAGSPTGGAGGGSGATSLHVTAGWPCPRPCPAPPCPAHSCCMAELSPLLDDRLACTAERQSVPSCSRPLQHRDPAVRDATSEQKGYACEKPLPQA